MADRTAPQTATPSDQPSADPSAEARGDAAAAKPDKQRPVLPPMPAEQPAATKPARGARKSAPARKAPASNGTGAGSSTPAPAVQPAAPAAAAPAAPAASGQPVRKPVLPPPPAQPAAPKLPLSQRLQAKFGSPGGAQGVPPAVPPAAPRATPPPTPAASPRRPPQAAPPPGPGDTAPVPVTRSLADGGTAGMAAASASSRPTVAPTPVARAPKAPRPAREAQQRRTPAAGMLRPSRRARLRLTRIDPWSVMKTAFLLSVALGIVTVVAVMTVWSVLGAAGLWESINATVQSVLGGDTGSTFDVTDYLGTSRVLGFTTLVAIADVVLLTAIATLAAFLYNMAAALLGGIELTLTEDGN